MRGLDGEPIAIDGLPSPAHTFPTRPVCGGPRLRKHVYRSGALPLFEPLSVTR